MAVSSNVFNVAVVLSFIDKFTRPMTRMTSGMGKLQQQLYYADRYMQDAFVKGTIAAVGMTAAINKMVDAYKWLETASVNMTTALKGDIEAADELIEKIRNMAENSPLTAEPLINSANILLSYGVQKDDIMDTLKRLGDLSKGKDDVLESLVMGYSRIIAEDRVTREHLDRFIFKGQIPIYDALAKSMNLTKEQLAKEMQAGNVRAENIINAVHLLTDQGGQFYDAMNKLNDTLEGQTQQFLEKLDRVFGAFGGVLAPFFKEALKTVINPMLTDTKKIIEGYLSPTKIEYINGKNNKGLKTNEVTKVIWDSETTVNIWTALKKVLDALKPDLTFLTQVMENLKNGTSLFYVFVDILVSFINGLKTAFKVFTVILNVLRPFRNIIGFLAGAFVFLAPFLFVLTKLASLSLFWFSILKNGIGTLIALKKNISFLPQIIKMLTSPFSVIITKFKLLFTGLFTFIKGGLIGAFTAIKGAIAGLAGTALGTVAIIGIVIAAVIGLSLIFGQLYKRFEWFRKIVDGFTGFLYKIADKLKSMGGIFEFFGKKIENISNAFRAFFQGDLFSLLLSMFKMAADSILGIFILILAGASFVFNKLNDFLGTMGINWLEAVAQKTDAILNGLRGVSDNIQKMLDDNAKARGENIKENAKVNGENTSVNIENNNNITTKDPDTTVETETFFYTEINTLPNGAY
ncbi:tape measure protein [Brachyspira innocens]|uniref:Tape measure protein n=1 Tax=Brachyspira innocens TaxID=13264 RepID=A0ABT8YW24_9SPIR|nr:tape measure protein [Brachyspira innocens]MDO6993357.1 tape measure protein [Brachyspira innocens]MDO7019398.1 tape measure protein [Brachyspira innocens]